MTTYFAFAPSRTSVPQFSPTLDGAQYLCSCTWNLFAQRYYLNCFDQDGNRIFSQALVETAPALAINTLAWSELTMLVTAATQAPHGFSVGSVIDLTIAGCSPAAYNGWQSATITGPSTFTYQLNVDPGANVVAGSASTLINLAAGYFQTSTLVFRNSAFETNP